MDFYTKAAVERAMKVQEVILRALAKKMTWWQSSGDPGDQRPADAAAAGALGGVWVSRIVGPAMWEAVAETSTGGRGGEGVGTVSREVFRSQRTPFSREAGRGASGGAELRLGQGSAARIWVGGARAAARGASETASPAAAAGHVAAHRGQSASLVSGRALVRLDRDFGRCHEYRSKGLIEAPKAERA
jgi:hypothetical protein